MFAGGLLVATFIDLEWLIIPDEVSLPGAARVTHHVRFVVSRPRRGRAP